MSCMSDPSQSGKTEGNASQRKLRQARDMGVMVLRTFAETKVRRPPGRNPTNKIFKRGVGAARLLSPDPRI
jgi:hypothetical protein